ncbi:hypothetical protein [Actinoplanes sp. NPDC049265]|uniref:hypothetical protein n=1 Tax=Actinoplanes sp. NPDC049265 TaxID=3363902 RepID=UPI0037123FEE
MTDQLEPPDPGGAHTLDDLAARLRTLKIWAGDPSYETIRARVSTAWRAAGRPAAEAAGKNTVADCFRTGRRRINADLVVAIVAALHDDPGYVNQWRQALRVISGETAGGGQVRVLGTLPPSAGDFTGRAADLTRLRARLRAGQVATITGPPGTGKTRLAVHTGHALLHAGHVDRALFVNLRGYHPDGPPADPAAVLDGFLRVLGVPAARIPHTPAARRAAVRAAAGDRTLLILDNAADAAQIQPLLTGGPALITSRRRPAGLAATVALGPFTAQESAAFLARELAGIPVGADPHAAARIAERCGHLPLALSVLAAHARATPGWTLTDHAERLDEVRPHDTVLAAIGLSYRRLTPDRQTLLRLAALHPGPDTDERALAALTGAALPATRAALLDLRRDHLLDEPAPGRYALHDLIRAYARDRSADEDPPQTRRDATTRLLDHYVTAAATAAAQLNPAEADLLPAAPPGPLTPALSSVGAAVAWLDSERVTLLAAMALTAAPAWHTQAIQLSAALSRYLYGGHVADACTVHETAMHAARALGDRPAEAWSRIRLGVAMLTAGRLTRATEHINAGRRLFAQFSPAGDVTGQAATAYLAGVVHAAEGRLEPATHDLRLSIGLFRATDRPASLARCLTALAGVERRQGDLDTAAAHLAESARLSATARDALTLAKTRTVLGEVETGRGNLSAAARHLGVATRLCRATGQPAYEAWALHSLARVREHQGRTAEALRAYRDALDGFRRTGQQDGERAASRGLAAVAQPSAVPS